MIVYHRCPQCLWTVKSATENFAKLVQCPYDQSVMENFDDEITIFSNLEYHISSARDGFYSLALGRIVDSEAKEEEIMRSRGFIKESELNRKHKTDNYVDHLLQLANIREKEIERLTNIYKQAIADGKTKEEAVALAYNTEDALSGQLDKLFSNNLKDMENYNAGNE